MLQLRDFRKVIASLEPAIEIFDHYRIYNRLIEMRALKAQALFLLGNRRDGARVLRSARERAYELDLPVNRRLAVAEEFNCDSANGRSPCWSLQTGPDGRIYAACCVEH